MDGRNYEPMTYEFTYRFYLVGLNMFIISSVTFPPSGFVEVQFKPV